MAEKKRGYEDEEMILSPMRLVMVDGSVLDPAAIRNDGQKRQILDPTMEGAVKRLIAHLKDEQ